MYTPPLVRAIYDQHEKELLNIPNYVETLAVVNAYYALHMDLQAEATVKHYIWQTEHNFKGENLYLSNLLREELMSPFGKRLKEPP